MNISAMRKQMPDPPPGSERSLKNNGTCSVGTAHTCDKSDLPFKQIGRKQRLIRRHGYIRWVCHDDRKGCTRTRQLGSFFWLAGAACRVCLRYFTTVAQHRFNRQNLLEFSWDHHCSRHASLMLIIAPTHPRRWLAALCVVTSFGPSRRDCVSSFVEDCHCLY